MTIGTRLLTWWSGELVGSDSFGNRYYRRKGTAKLIKGGGMESRDRRWVIYRGEAEPSKVPAEWHGWLHHTCDTPPDESAPRRPWQKPHLPNLTGTASAYRPPGSIQGGGRRAAAAGDYEPWIP